MPLPAKDRLPQGAAEGCRKPSCLVSERLMTHQEKEGSPPLVAEVLVLVAAVGCTARPQK